MKWNSPNSISVQYAVTESERTRWSSDTRGMAEMLISIWHWTGYTNGDAIMLVKRKSIEKLSIWDK